MRINGSWRLCDDGIVRPVVWGEVRANDGSWVQAFFLTDCAADRTVFSENVWRSLGLAGVAATARLEGVGGSATSVVVETQIRMAQETGQTVLFKGHFAAFTDPAALDISVLGRDISNMFALIVDRPQDVVSLLGRGHQYKIFQA
jgi:hypothetical protein